MRRVFNGVARGVVAVAVMVVLAAPAEAKPTDEGWTPSKIVKAIKRLVVKTLGDGLVVPRP